MVVSWWFSTPEADEFDNAGVVSLQDGG